MAGPAPTEIHTTAQDEKALHINVGGELKKINQPAETVPAQEQSPLSEDVEDVLGSAAYALGSTAEEAFSGKTVDTDIRITPAGKAGRWAIDRIKRMKGVFTGK